MRKTNLFTAVIFLAASSFAFGQDSPMQPTPVVPGTILGPELIIWSQEQKPQPVPQPLPPPDSPAQKPSQPEQQQPGDPTSSQSQQSANPPAATSPTDSQQTGTQSFTGTISKDNGKYVLKTSQNTVYQIDDQDKAKGYEGKPVKITGTLDTNSNTVHVTSIEILS